MCWSSFISTEKRGNLVDSIGGGINRKLRGKRNAQMSLIPFDWKAIRFLASSANSNSGGFYADHHTICFALKNDFHRISFESLCVDHNRTSSHIIPVQLTSHELENWQHPPSAFCTLFQPIFDYRNGFPFTDNLDVSVYIDWHFWIRSVSWRRKQKIDPRGNKSPPPQKYQ